MGQGRKAIVSQVPGGCGCGCGSGFGGEGGLGVGVRAVFEFVFDVCDGAGG